MSTEWWIVRVDPKTRAAAPGASTFFPSSAEWNELDLVLAGSAEGPISAFLAKCSNSPASEDKCPGSFGDARAVKALAKKLAAIPPERFAPIDVVIPNCLHSIPTAEERASDPEFYDCVPTAEEFYSHLVETAEEFRRFVAEAAERGDALEVQVAG